MEWHFTKLPHTIFDIEGAREVAIETGSFSKLAGFSGVRLKWTNARILREALPVPTYGTDAPYTWANFGKDSWEIFQDLLENAHLITTPGSGYGPSR